MITAVDTNVLLEVFGGDRKFGRASAEAVRRRLEEGALLACEVVWAKTATAFPNVENLRSVMADLSVSFDSLSEEAAVKAAEVWRHYRARGGRRTRIVTDF